MSKVEELVAKWRARANEPEYKLHTEWAIDQCADELSVALDVEQQRWAEVLGEHRFNDDGRAGSATVLCNCGFKYNCSSGFSHREQHERHCAAVLAGRE